MKMNHTPCRHLKENITFLRSHQAQVVVPESNKYRLLFKTYFIKKKKKKKRKKEEEEVLNDHSAISTINNTCFFTH